VKGRVLVVDNEASIREMLALVLDSEGYEVEQAADGGEALAAAARVTPDVILLDMKMPGIDGREFAARYRKAEGPKAPIIVITAAQAAEQAAAEVEACGYLGKPFGIDQLLEVIGECVAKGDRVRPGS
jgi:CheY-like chemotaxis protein